ncbi:ankyrin repeat-containing domain protein [Flagelloscypha sp. PMI_526]|nr:ankyrin repeat-containing domain protein [Flagelloscypha sp. PMI_526]
MPSTIPPSLVNEFVLHTAASAGDEEGVRAAIHAGADVNQLDDLGRSPLMRAIGGDDWEAIIPNDRQFLSQGRINTIRALMDATTTLLTLNGPQSSLHGVTVLSLASWLNLRSIVEVLLDESSGRVCVDGMDSHGATALMYATRDNSLDVASLLLAHEARPDYRDCKQRSAIYYAQPHPYLLFLCEKALRKHRLDQFKQAGSFRGIEPSSFTRHGRRWIAEIEARIIASQSFRPSSSQAIIDAVVSQRLPRLDAAVFSPPTSPPSLVNLPDAKGWSAIHYCTSATCPSIEILDALYLAGADISLPTAKEEYSPLHVLALSSQSSPDITSFISHLVVDLHAPLSSQNSQGETCIHIAAEHGNTVVLEAFLRLDTSGLYRTLTNSRGLTALQVAKSDLRVLFGEIKIPAASTAGSHYAIRATSSLHSLASMNNWLEPNTVAPPSPTSPMSAYDPIAALFHHLQATSLSSSQDGVNISSFEASLKEIPRLGQLIGRQSAKRTGNISADIAELRTSLRDLTELRHRMSSATRTKCKERHIVPLLPYGMPRQSEDSEKTLVNRSRSSSIVDEAKSQFSRPSSSDGRGSRVSMRKRQWTPDEIKSGSLKLKTWLKQKMSPLEIFSGVSASALMDPNPTIDFQPTREVTSRTPPKLKDNLSVALKNSQIILSAVENDITAISQCLDNCESFLRRATSYVARAERLVTRTMKSRRAQLDLLLQRPVGAIVRHKSSLDRSVALARNNTPPSSPLLSVPPSPQLSLSPSISSLSSVSTTRSRCSSILSTASTVITPNKALEDEDVRLLRRLLVRKMEAHVEGALDELEVALKWTKVVKEVLRSLKTRTQVIA